MTMKSGKNKPCSCERMNRKEVVLDDGFRYEYFQCPNCSRVEYKPCEAQKLMDYAESHQFMFVDDWILAWLYVGDGAPISGIVKLQKELFVILKEFAQDNNIPSENPGFRAYKFGPYTERINRSVQTLMDLGFVESVGRIDTSNERFFLTDAGKNAGHQALSKLSEEQISLLKKLKNDLQQMDAQGIMTYVYSHYPDYTNESVVFEKTLHRRRK